MFSFRIGATVIAGHIGDQLQLGRLEAGQPAVEDELVAVLVVLLVIDQVAHILQTRGRFK